MPKYYIMLVDQAHNQMRVPVKALQNPYNNRPAFSAGMPQFFGGTDTNDQPPVTVLDQEITQESRRTLELTTHAPPYFYTSENMFFYWSAEGGWRQTATPWGPAQNNAEAEMDRIVIVDLTQFDANMTNDQIITELVNQTGSQGAPPQGQADFNASATRIAFITLMRMYLSGQL